MMRMPTGLIRLAVVALFAAAPLGCSSPAPKVIPAPLPPPLGPGPIPTVDEADYQFQQHNWQTAIDEYSRILHAHPEPGGVGDHGSKAYLRRRVSLALEYMGLIAKHHGSYDTAIAKLKSAVRADPTNSDAARILSEVTYEEKHGSREQWKFEGDTQ